MRDPVFYRWHAFINEIFIEHKNILVSEMNQMITLKQRFSFGISQTVAIH